MLYHLLLLPLIFATPEININWDEKSSEKVNIKLIGKDEQMETCLMNGLELRYNFQLQLCKRRPFWFDTCQPMKQLVRSVHYDLISRNYEIEEHRSPAVTKRILEKFSTSEEMVESLYSVSDISLLYVAEGESEYVNSKRSYISVRIYSECEGSHNEALAELSNIITLGLIEVSGFDSGWVDFSLRY